MFIDFTSDVWDRRRHRRVRSKKSANTNHTEREKKMKKTLVTSKMDLPKGESFQGWIVCDTCEVIVTYRPSHKPLGEPVSLPYCCPNCGKVFGPVTDTKTVVGLARYSSVDGYQPVYVEDEEGDD